jgi:hypothetical protein
MTPAIEPIYWLSWIVFFIGAFAVILGGFLELRYGKHVGLYYTFSGFIGLALSGLLMTIAFGIP